MNVWRNCQRENPKEFPKHCLTNGISEGASIEVVEQIFRNIADEYLWACRDSEKDSWIVEKIQIEICVWIYEKNSEESCQEYAEGIFERIPKTLLQEF